MSPNIPLYKQKLEEQKTHLEAELSTVAHKKGKTEVWDASSTEFDIDTDADPNVTADKIEEFETNQAITESFKSELRDINDALQRVEVGTYGICEECGQPIEDDRLEANPSARTCKAHMN